MAKLTSGTRYVISGDPLPVGADPPQWLQAHGIEEWYVAQPPDWLYDNAGAVYRSEYARFSSMPESQKYRKESASPFWQAVQKERHDRWRKRVEELQGKESLTVEEEIEWDSIVEQSKNAPDPNEYTLLDELCHHQASEAYYDYLLPRCIVDGDGVPLIDVDSEQGREWWGQLKRMPSKVRALRDAMSEAEGIIELAKNSEAGQGGETE